MQSCMQSKVYLVHVSICRIIHKYWNNLSGASLKFGLNSAPAHRGSWNVEGILEIFWQTAPKWRIENIFWNKNMKVFIFSLKDLRGLWRCLWFHSSCGSLSSIHLECFSKISMGHFQTRSESLWEERYGFSIRTYKSTTYWNLVSPCAVFSWAVLCVDNFWETNSFGAFPITEWKSWSRALWRFNPNISKHNILEFGDKSWSICWGAAGFCVDIFWKTICFGGISKHGVKVFEHSAINI